MVCYMDIIELFYKWLDEHVIQEWHKDNHTYVSHRTVTYWGHQSSSLHFAIEKMKEWLHNNISQNCAI